jgi:hypothetical protein
VVVPRQDPLHTTIDKWTVGEGAGLSKGGRSSRCPSTTALGRAWLLDPHHLRYEPELGCSGLEVVFSEMM